MAKLTLKLPSMLHSLADGQREFVLDAANVEELFDELKSRYPSLAAHLFEPSGELRPHVLCFHNDSNTRWGGAQEFQEGDTIRFLQAVSGG